MGAVEGAAAVAVRLPLRRLLAAMAGVYVTQSAVSAMIFQSVPAVLREAEVALDSIGLISLLMVPWTLKFLWSSLVEGWRLTSDGRRLSRPLIVSGQTAMAVLLAGLAALAPAEHFAWLFAGLVAVAVISATVDIVADGFMIEQLKPEHRGWGNVAQIGGGYAGIMVGGGAFLVVADAHGWQTAMLALVVVVTALAVPCLLTPEPRGDAVRQARHRPSLLKAARRPEIRWGLLAVLICQLGLRLVLILSGPFLIDNGLTPADLGVLTGTIGIVLCLAAIAVAGGAVRRWGARPVLLVLLGAQSVVFVLYLLAALQPISTTLLSGLFLGKSAIFAGTFVALYTVLMGWTSPDQTGVDFTLFQCADALVSVVAGLCGGVIAHHLGYGTCFALAAAAALGSLVLLPRIFRRADGHGAP